MGCVEEFTKKIMCPHCQKDFTATVSTAITASVVLGSEGRMPDEIKERRGDKVAPTYVPKSSHTNFLESIDPAQKATLEMAERAGMLTAYANAFQHAHGNKIDNPHKSFLAWLRIAKSRQIAREVMSYFATEFGGSIRFVAHQSVGAVLSNGVIVEFLPCQTVGDAPAGGIAFEQSGKQLVENTQQWVRTKYGYVAKSGEFMNSMRKKSFGEFCNPIL